MSESRKKDLGAFYTPEPITRMISDWALRSPSDRALDPSYGELAFLSSAARRLRELGASPDQISSQLYGAELDSEVASTARQSDLRIKSGNLINASFFSIRAGRELPAVEAVIGNPPYIRYQSFNKSPDSEIARELAQDAGLPLTKLSSSWAPFVAHSLSFVAPGGRFAQVLPAELLHAQYASDLVELLERSFKRVVIALFEPRIFPGALEEVILLFCDDKRAKAVAARARYQAELIEADQLSDLRELISGDAPRRVSAKDSDEKLLFRLLPQKTQALYMRLADSERVSRLGELGSVDIGAVTGDNSFFLLSEDEIESLTLPRALLRPAVSKTRQIPGAIVSSADLAELASRGQPVKIFSPPAKASARQLSGAKRYLNSSEARRARARYKVKIRGAERWWAIPLPKGGAPDLFLTYCSGSHPRLVFNEAAALNTNTIHGVYLSQKRRARALAASWPNSLSLLSAELSGRSYGGGVLKLEPTEAERVLIPDPPAGIGRRLAATDRAIRSGGYDELISETDSLVLKPLGISDSEIKSLQRAHQKLRGRREARSAKP